jgi:hypothetical protein
MPALVAVLLGACKALGFSTPFVYLRVVKVTFGLLSILTGLGVFRLARAFKAGEWASTVAASLWFLAGPVVYFAPRAMSENACAAPLVWGTALLFEEGASRRKLLLGSSLLGLAVLFRLQVAVVLIAIVIVLGVRRQWSMLKTVLPTLIVWAVLYGALDAFTWHALPNAKVGGWYHSVVVYVRFNLIEGRGAHWGTADWTYFFHYLWTSMPTVTTMLVVGVVGALVRKQWVLPFLIGFFVLLHLPIGHKELRFMLPGLPLACACVAVAMSGLADRPQLLVVGVAGAISFLHVPSLTMGELGAYLERPQSSAWGDFGQFNRLLLRASQQSDLCGLRIDGADMAWVGGSTYLHTNAKLYRPWMPPQNGFFNYLIAQKGLQGIEVIAEDGGVALYRLPIPACRPDPSFTWQLG